MICNVKINPVSFLYRRTVTSRPAVRAPVLRRAIRRAHSRTGALTAIWLQDTPFGDDKLKLTPIYRSMKNINFWYHFLSQIRRDPENQGDPFWPNHEPALKRIVRVLFYLIKMSWFKVFSVSVAPEESNCRPFNVWTGWRRWWVAMALSPFSHRVHREKMTKLPWFLRALWARKEL